MTFGQVSGGHFNPAVTLGVLATSEEAAGNIWYAGMIILSQFFGAGFGCLISRAAVIDSETRFEPNLGYTLVCPGGGFGSDCDPDAYWVFVIIMEMVATFVFVTLILNLKKINGSDNDILNAFSIALTLYGMLAMIGAMTGGCLNPAVGLAQVSYQMILLPGSKGTAMPIYIFAPALGGLIAGVF